MIWTTVAHSLSAGTLLSNGQDPSSLSLLSSSLSCHGQTSNEAKKKFWMFFFKVMEKKNYTNRGKL